MYQANVLIYTYLNCRCTFYHNANLCVHSLSGYHFKHLTVIC